jgi:hypothetical protein
VHAASSGRTHHRRAASIARPQRGSSGRSDLYAVHAHATAATAPRARGSVPHRRMPAYHSAVSACLAASAAVGPTALLAASCPQYAASSSLSRLRSPTRTRSSRYAASSSTVPVSFQRRSRSRSLASLIGTVPDARRSPSAHAGGAHEPGARAFSGAARGPAGGTCRSMLHGTSGCRRAPREARPLGEVIAVAPELLRVAVVIALGAAAFVEDHQAAVRRRRETCPWVVASPHTKTDYTNELAGGCRRRAWAASWPGRVPGECVPSRLSSLP